MTLDIDAELAVCEAATPGPWWPIELSVHRDWTSDSDERVTAGIIEGPFYWPGPESSYWKLEDATFVSHAREACPEALRRLKRLRELIVEGEVLYQGYTEKLYGIVEPSFSVDIAKEIRELLNIKET